MMISKDKHLSPIEKQGVVPNSWYFTDLRIISVSSSTVYSCNLSDPEM